jgi:hypothetical protein
VPHVPCHTKVSCSVRGGQETLKTLETLETLVKIVEPAGFKGHYGKGVWGWDLESGKK